MTYWVHCKITHEKMPEAKAWLEAHAHSDYFITGIDGIRRDIWAFWADWNKSKSPNLKDKVYEFVIHFKWRGPAVMFKMIYG
jgi:hypothetical protein